MSEKRHKTKKFANYQNVIVRNSPALGRHVFVSSQNRWIYGFFILFAGKWSSEMNRFDQFTLARSSLF